MNMRYKKTLTSDEIYHDLLEKIINLEYVPGEGISENELCEKYETTRHTIRGALVVLKEKGFVDVVPQKGTYVTLIDLELIDVILFLRSAVEQEALHVIFKNKDNSGLIKELKTCLEKQIEYSAENQKEFYELDDEFHSMLLDAAGRASVQNLYNDAYLHVRRWRNMEVGAQERMGMLPEEHHNIIKAIENGDENSARMYMNCHINSVDLFGKELKSKYPKYFVI